MNLPRERPCAGGADRDVDVVSERTNLAVTCIQVKPVSVPTACYTAPSHLGPRCSLEVCHQKLAGPFPVSPPLSLGGSARALRDASLHGLLSAHSLALDARHRFAQGRRAARACRPLRIRQGGRGCVGRNSALLPALASHRRVPKDRIPPSDRAVPPGPAPRHGVLHGQEDRRSHGALHQ